MEMKGSSFYQKFLNEKRLFRCEAVKQKWKENEEGFKYNHVL